MSPRLTGIVGSLGLHALLILSLLHATASAPKPPPQGGTAWLDHDETPPIKHLRGADDVDGVIHCANSYIGIGVLIASFRDRVLMVGENTPAERGGLLPGDYILNPSELGTNFEEGHVLNLRVSRDGVELAITVAVRRICQD